ncbi:MAG: 50S ribosomal protein L25/general stress protein Ctc [Dysgonamonadaceae bacterium]|jgi:large subunit ribosomal protein L25|nr:50S ribosomal protein L25/general stress protein Ctc [Dysgonamonadaceae bacterium]
MKTFNLDGTLRTDLGKKAAKSCRNEGLVPCVLYGGEGVVHFNVTKDAVRKLVYTPEIYIVELKISGKKYLSIMKDLQFHPVSDQVLHIDFYQIKEKKPVTVEIPVVLEGLAEGVKAGGKLSLEMRKLRVKGLYKDLPERLVINVEDLSLGKTIQVGQLNFPKLELLNSKENVVCAVKLTRAARGAAAKSA